MNVTLDPVEARLIGCLIEKEITTPDQYPLSLNALVNAANQKTNREPVLELDASTVQVALDALSKRHLVMEKSGFGSRVVKYRHRLCNGEHNPRQFSAQELAIVCELLLRGAQTPGELRSRGQRLAQFADVHEAEAALNALASRADGPYVRQLARAPGERESRWRHLFGPEPDEPVRPASLALSPPPAAAAPRVSASTDLEARIAELERAVAVLTEELKRLRGAQ